jgi:hypothetical protein
MGLIAALLLVERAPGFGDIHLFSPRDILQKYYGIGDTALVAYNQPLQIASLV